MVDRTYVLGNSVPSNAGDGILVFETAWWRMVEHHLSGRTFSCLAVSADGARLYATEPTSHDLPLPATDPQLVTVDAATGRELSGVALNLGDCCALLMTAAGAAD